MSESTSYLGGKSGSGTYQTIINQIPPHLKYFEIFGGKLGIYRHKAKAKSSYIIEKDSKLIDYYEEKLNFKALLDSKLFEKRIKYFDEGEYCLEGCSLKLFNEVSLSLIDQGDVFIYADPPYPLESRKSSYTRYKHEFSNEDHLDLLNTLNCFNEAKVAISTYPNELYDEFFLGREWRFIEFESQTRGGKAIEQLWMNYPEPTQLHDYQYLGEDYRERERISRKLKRWEAKFQDLAPLEQMAMLQRLNKTLDMPSEKHTSQKIKPSGSSVERSVKRALKQIYSVEEPISDTAELTLYRAAGMYERGMSLDEIAAVYDMSYNRLTAELRRRGLWEPIAKMIKKRRFAKNRS